jgi:hypothetical protein
MTIDSLTRSLPLSLLLAALGCGAALAQDDKKAPTAPGVPEPKQKEHDALQAFVGTWDVTMRSEAMPGVPGMEKAMESTGTEHCELLNNGLWLKSTTNATMDGKPFQCLWLVGYDPFAKSYVGIFASSDETQQGLCTMTGSHDDAKKSWLWSGQTPHGEMRSVVVASDPDNQVETCFMKGPDGKEAKCMEITRKRSSRTPAPTAAEATASKADNANLPKQIAAMQQDIGSWDAVVRCTGVPGQPATEEKATERVSAVCGGKWLWSDFAGRFQGQPFEGHCLTGFDPKENKVVSIWIDSMSPLVCKTTGAVGASDKELVLEGKCMDPTGQPMTVEQRLSRTDASTRTLRMKSTCSQGTSTMDITYRRKAN